MCDRTQTNEENVQNVKPPRRDVDDLIFRDEKEWLASDR